MGWVMRDEVRKCLRNWRWWVALPALAVVVYGGRAAEAAAMRLHQAHELMWRWVSGGGR